MCDGTQSCNNEPALQGSGRQGRSGPLHLLIQGFSQLFHVQMDPPPAAAGRVVVTTPAPTAIASMAASMSAFMG
jgi:hypothetical protein